jgi:hypothetical protein
MTLLEVIISLGLMTLLVGAMFGFYDISLRTRDIGRRTIDHGELAWRILHRIAEDIRAANGFVPSLGSGIRGYRQQITLQSVVLPDKEVFYPRAIEDRPLPGQCDIREVRYYLGVDPENLVDYPDPESPDGGTTQAPETLGIVRRELKTFRQTGPQTGQREVFDVDLISDKARYLRFRYFDGVEWTDVWQPQGGGGFGSSLPQAVEITVGFDPVPPEDPNQIDIDKTDQEASLPEPYNPDRYTLVVRLNQADAFFGSRLMRASRRAFGGSDGSSGPTGGLTPSGSGSGRGSSGGF